MSRRKSKKAEVIFPLAGEHTGSASDTRSAPRLSLWSMSKSKRKSKKTARFPDYPVCEALALELQPAEHSDIESATGQIWRDRDRGKVLYA